MPEDLSPFSLDAVIRRVFELRAIKRNPFRFPPDFAFQLTEDEWGNLKSHFGMSSSCRKIS
jgi:hypothetical protein